VIIKGIDLPQILAAIRAGEFDPDGGRATRGSV
jgi:hypothetical protein